MERGICPACESTGPVGGACSQKACMKLGYHHIPVSYFEKLGDGTLDPVIGRNVDEYLIVSRLGRGGFGSVYLALQQPINLPCALKLIHESMEGHPNAQPFLQKFRAEAEALARLNHPNIVRLVRYGTFDWRPYMVMELVEGQPLRNLIHQHRVDKGLIPRKIVEHIVMQLLNALGAAHAERIVHRDIKPENILLQPTVGDPNFVRVVDFGLAKFVADGSRTSIITGTPDYMPPEQVMGVNIGPASDLYSVGVLIYEMWTGLRLYEGIPKEKVFMVKVEPGHDPVSRVRPQRPELSPAEWAFLERALACEPKDRYASAADMLAAWQRLGDTCIVPPVSTRSTMDAVLPDGTAAYVDEEPSAAPETPATPRSAPKLSTGLSVVRGSRGPLFWVSVVTAALLLAAGGLFMFGKKKTTNGPEPPAAGSAAAADVQVRAEPDVSALPDVAAAREVAASLDVVHRPEQAGVPEVAIVAEVARQPEVSVKPDVPAVQEVATTPEVVAPPEVAAPEPVTVTVKSHPKGATVWRGRENLGKAPVDVSVMPDETVRLSLKLKGHVTESVKVRAGDGARTVRLEKVPPPPDEDGEVKIVVDSSPPGVLVSEGGTKLGKTPKTLLVKRKGKRKLTLSRAGYKTVTVTISGKGKKKIKVPMEEDSF